MINDILKGFYIVLALGVMSIGYNAYGKYTYSQTVESELIEKLDEIRSIDNFERAYTTTLDINNGRDEGYIVNGELTFLSSDETGEKIDVWTKFSKFMEDHWSHMDTFAGYGGGKQFREWIKVLKKYDIPVDAKRYHPQFYSLEKIARIGDSEGKTIWAELEGCRNQNWVDRSYLHYVAAYGCIECVKIMVEEYGADVNWPDCHGKTPAMNAAIRQHYEVVQYLVPLMSREALDQQEMFVAKGATLYDETYSEDVSSWNGGNPMLSITENKHFLYQYGVRSKQQLNAERKCFSRLDRDADAYRDNIVVKQKIPVPIIVGENNPVVDDCLFLHFQYEYNCENYDFDCDKQKQLTDFLVIKGFDMSHLETIRYLFYIIIPDETLNSILSSFRRTMEDKNGKRCNSNFSDCDQELVRERSSLGVVHRGN